MRAQIPLLAGGGNIRTGTTYHDISTCSISLSGDRTVRIFGVLPASSVLPGSPNHNVCWGIHSIPLPLRCPLYHVDSGLRLRHPERLPSRSQIGRMKISFHPHQILRTTTSLETGITTGQPGNLVWPQMRCSRPCPAGSTCSPSLSSTWTTSSVTLPRLAGPLGIGKTSSGG